ncbi:acyltransferase domain-containing protein [Pseudonocardia sp. ICBG601]|uniref:acyltransferase domain-containing protein n=1 Tax=Pseudonocardia sp. ICBG601 TaxID=2846759 RepID=UPI001CF6CD1E|nr:acyltransferase domain-containing protein [Pseudonocardia sp. ICBG601]
MNTNPVLVMPGTVPAPRGGILHDLHARHDGVREVLARIDEAARGLDLPAVSPRLVEGGEVAPGRGPDLQYVEIFAVSIATHRALVGTGVEPAALVGQSVGELWALAAAGYISVEDTVRLAVARSRALTRQDWQGTMIAVGVDGRRAEHLAGLFGHPDLVLACENAPHQSVLSGPTALTADIERVAAAAGWPTNRLDVPHPTHSPALARSARELRADAPRVPYGGGRVRVCSPWLGRDVADDDPVELMAGALTARVRILDTIRELHASGADVFVECGERAVVAKMIQASVPGVRCTVPLAERDAPAVLAGLTTGTPSRNGAHPGVPVVVRPESTVAVPTPATDPPAAVRPPSPAAVATPAARPEPVEPAPAPSAPAPSGPALSGGAPSAGARDYDAVLAQLRDLYGGYLGYPPDLLGEDDSLEADLGVESLKQVALLGQVADLFNLPDLRSNASLLGFGSLRRIADAVVAGGAVGEAA